MVRSVSLADAAAVCRIYNHYVAGSTITFEEQGVSEDEMKVRIGETVSTLPWLVWEKHGEVIGYAYAAKWKTRSAYRFSVESTIYLRHDEIGRGIGRRLYEQLLAELKARGVHAVIGGIALPNAASEKLHERLGFKKVAHFKQVGWKFQKWIDVGYWQLIFAADTEQAQSHPAGGSP
jgi:phosphinothricin acetyltransferase